MTENEQSESSADVGYSNDDGAAPTPPQPQHSPVRQQDTAGVFEERLPDDYAALRVHCLRLQAAGRRLRDEVHDQSGNIETLQAKYDSCEKGRKQAWSQYFAVCRSTGTTPFVGGSRKRLRADA